MGLGPGTMAAAFADAWSMIDAIWQVHELHDRPAFSMDRPIEGKPVVQVSAFKKAVKHVRGVRNKGQHRDIEGPKAAEAGLPAWGTLCWLVVAEGHPPTGKSCLLISNSSDNTGRGQFINPAGLAMRAGIDHVQLCAFDETVDLSDMLVHLRISPTNGMPHWRRNSKTIHLVYRACSWRSIGLLGFHPMVDPSHPHRKHILR
jgi:hypothetical protein